MMHRLAERWFFVLPVLAALSISAVARADVSAEESGAPAYHPERQEYGEFEAIPAPEVRLHSGLEGDLPEAGSPQPFSGVPDAQEGLPASDAPDPLMDEVNREVEARRGIVPASPGEPIEPRRDFSTPYSLMKAFAWLLVVVAMILVAHHFLQRRSNVGGLLTGNRLGAVLGRLYLNPRVCLHFVRTGGKVLVVGQTQNALSLIARFDEAEFAESAEAEAQAHTTHAATTKEKPEGDRPFYAQLRANLTQMTRRDAKAGASEPDEDVRETVDDDDIAALRGDIHRLQEYLRESTRGSED